MSTDNVDQLRNGYEAFKRRDMPVIFNLFDDEIVFYQSELLPWGGKYHGLQGVKEFFAKLLHHIDSQVDPQQFVEAGDSVVVIARLHGRVRVNNKPFDLSAVHVWTFRNGKAVRFEVYIDTPQMLQALEG